MRIVVDTNVFVSAALKSKRLPWMALYKAAQCGILLKSATTEAQLLDVIARPNFAPLIAPDTLAWIRKLIAEAECITVTERITVCRDSTDDKFLELAVNGHADLILTGDKDLLVLNPFRNIPIVTPSIFVQAVTRR